MHAGMQETNSLSGKLSQNLSHMNQNFNAQMVEMTRHCIILYHNFQHFLR